MLKNTNSILFILSLFLLPSIGKAQLSPEKEKQLDGLFEQWKAPNQPGVAAGLIKEDEVLYLKSYGNADIENNKPFTSNTVINVSNFSKQMLAFAVLLLEEQGKLAMSDDVRKYLPEMPDYGHTITLKHLISQSSGLHDFWALKELAGWRASDVFTQQDALTLIYSQKELDYTPGTDFSTTTSGLVLLAEVVAKVTGASFVDYTTAQIFQPLGMNNTTFCDEPNKIIANMASSYQEENEEFVYNKQNVTVLGAWSLYSTAADLAKWYQNFHSPKVGSAALIKKLESPVTLDNGGTYFTTSGELTYGQQEKHAERGTPKLWIYGFSGGHSAILFRFVKEGFTSFVIGNGGTYNGYPTMNMLYQTIGDIFPNPPSIDFSKVKTLNLKTKQLEKYNGYYWNEKGAYPRRIYIKNDTMRYARIGQNRESLFIPVAKDKFQMVVGSDDEIFITFDEKQGKRRMIFTASGCNDIISTEYQPKDYSITELAAFTGTFYCDALQTTYTLSIKDGKLTATNKRKGDATFTPVKKDVFIGNSWFFNSLKYTRNTQGDITGFQVVSDGLANLQFQKIPINKSKV